MSILEIIEKYTDVTPDAWKSLSEQDIIRLEKKLKAEARMGDQLDINQVEAVVDLVRTRFGELSTLYRPEFKPLRNVLKSKGEIMVFPRSQTLFPVADEFLKRLLEEKFYDELHRYAMLCIKEDHYRGLQSFLFYKDMLPERLLDEMIQKLGQKIDYAHECIRMRISPIEQKIVYMLNPSFYRCLSTLGSGHFESAINDVYNNAIENLQPMSKNIFWRFIYAIAEFRAIQSNLREIFAENRRNTINMGISESQIPNSNSEHRGGTYKGADRSYSGEGKGRGAAWIIVVVIIGIIRIATLGSKDRDYDYDFNFDSSLGLKQSDIMRDDYEERIEEILFMQDTALDIIDVVSGGIDIDITNFRAFHYLPMPNYVTVVNNTDQPMVLLLEEPYSCNAITLKPNETDTLGHLITAFQIYTGKGPQRVEYVKLSSGLHFFDFRFAEFSDADREQLDMRYEFESFAIDKDYLLEINGESGNISVDMFINGEPEEAIEADEELEAIEVYSNREN